MNDNRHEPTEIPPNEHDTETGGDARSTTDLDDLRREIAELMEAIRARDEVDAQTSKPAPASIDGSAGRSNATLPLTAAALAAMKPAAIARLDWNTVRDVLANG